MLILLQRRMLECLVALLKCTTLQRLPDGSSQHETAEPLQTAAAQKNSNSLH
jgi:hypothetical protein